MEVRLPAIYQRPDLDIARDALSAIKARLPYSAEYMKLAVDCGFATLEGQAEWDYQKQRAEDVLRHVDGVKGIVNLIVIEPELTPHYVMNKIEAALKRSTEPDTPALEANDRRSTRTSSVRSWAERDEATRVA
jgi:osmotically-inducible protein OsmY